MEYFGVVSNSMVFMASGLKGLKVVGFMKDERNEKIKKIIRINCSI